MHKLEEYLEFLNGCMEICTETIFRTKGFTFYNLKDLIQHNYVVLVSGDKDSLTVVLNKNISLRNLKIWLKNIF